MGGNVAGARRGLTLMVSLERSSSSLRMPFHPLAAISFCRSTGTPAPRESMISIATRESLCLGPGIKPAPGVPDQGTPRQVPLAWIDQRSFRGMAARYTDLDQRT
jgi:hypothetical protein